MKTMDKSLLEEIIGSDWEIDEMEVEVEEECLKILALHQPVARDLRLIITIIKINNELERIADIAVNMAKRIVAIKENNDTGVASFDFDYRPMATLVQAMLKDCLDALVLEDPNRARKVFIEDDDVDHHCRKACKVITIEMDKNSQNATTLISFYLLALQLERIGDRCTNIAEEVIYLIEGEIIRGERS
jgi:phosphate transport system protein